MIAALTIAAVLAAPAVANKLPLAGGGEVTVQAKQFRYIFPKQRIEYTGDPVHLTRGDSHLACKLLVAQLDKAGEVSEATCEGDVRFERADRVVTCAKAIYEAATSRLTCQGKPAIKSGTLSATGSLLVYDLNTDEVTMENPEGAVPSPQVDAMLQQQQAKRKKGKEAQK